MFTGKRRVTLAVCETVSVANTGAASKARMLLNMGITPGENTMRAFRKEDSNRVENAARKISKRYRTMRKTRRMQTKAKKTDKAYKAGSFGLGNVLETAVNEPNKKKRKRESTQTSATASSELPSTSYEIEVVFVPDEDVVYLGSRSV